MTQPLPNQYIARITTDHEFDEYGTETITHTIVREFDTDRKLQRAIDEARVLYKRYVPLCRPFPIIKEDADAGSHIFSWTRTSEVGCEYLFRRVFKMKQHEQIHNMGYPNSFTDTY